MGHSNGTRPNLIKIQLGRVIGEESTFTLHEGLYFDKNEPTSSKKVAVKVEKKSSISSQLKYEYKVYKKLKKVEGFLKPITYIENESTNYLVIEPKGPSLQELFLCCNKVFSLKTVLLLADQLLAIIEIVHQQALIHRDVSPENFRIEQGRSNKIYLTNFGFSKEYLDSEGNHIPNRKDKKVIGALNFISMRGTLGFEQSRRDDLEALGYMLVYFLKGKLPWQDVPDYVRTNSKKLQEMGRVKKAFNCEKLCEGIPLEFREYMNYCRQLDFEETPNYNYLKQLFRVLFRVQNYEKNEYDWDNLTDVD